MSDVKLSAGLQILCRAYNQSDLDELLSFGADFANKTGGGRAETCRSLLNRQKESPGAGIQLHLMMGRLLSDACGDIPRILEGVDSIPAKNLPDEQVRSLIAIQTEALKRMNNTARRLGSLEHKQKSVQSVIEAKEPKTSKKSEGSKKDETRQLRDKLEAIRALERKLDETSGGN